MQSQPGIKPTCIGLIPARAGSKRINSKNTRILDSHPLIAYTIASALESGIFSRVLVSTDSPEIAEIAKCYGAEVPFLRPEEYAADLSPDIEWIRHLLGKLEAESECFAILRPTSPFRQPETFQRAWQLFLSNGEADSLRAVEKCAQHPAKMWILDKGYMKSVMENPDCTGTPWHSMPYQALPSVYAQNASLEISWCRIPLEEGTIAGKKILPFFTENYEGFDINRMEDWVIAEYLLANHFAVLPKIKVPI